MRIPLSWLHDFLPGKPSASEVAASLTRVGIEVGEIKNLAGGLDQVVVAQIEEARPHPGADRLTLCRVTDGTVQYEIVCGATNMKAGDRVALAKAGATLPNGLVIKKAKIRGENSEGMLCSATELGLAETSEGILILDSKAALGASVAEVLGRNETILELELTPNRGDCLSLIGIAREVTAAMNASGKIPQTTGEGPTESLVKVRVQDEAGAPRYVLRHLDSIQGKVSPSWMCQRLEAAGLRSIHPVVDVTNYVMLEWGQPLHAFDRAKLKGDIEVRRAREGEKILCLDGKERDLCEDDLVIADAEGPVAIAGVTGGERTAVGVATGEILLESAYFDPKSVRRTARRLSLHTESSHRFERSVDLAAVWAASTRAVELLGEICGARLLNGIDCRLQPRRLHSIRLRNATVRRLLGVDMDHAAEYLSRLGLSIERLEGGWQVEIPSRRPDLEREVDLVEEVARLHGYDQFSSLLPPLVPQEETVDRAGSVRRVKNCLAAAGLREIRGYSFVSEREAKMFFTEGLAESIVLTNPIHADLTKMRQTLLPSLVSAWKASASRQAPGARFFEVASLYGKAARDASSPAEERTGLAAIWAGEVEAQTWYRKARAADFFDARGVVESLFSGMSWGDPQFKLGTRRRYLNPKASATILWRRKEVGSVGEIHPTLQRALEVKQIIVVELDLHDLLVEPELPRRIRPLSSHPTVERDLAFVLKSGIPAEDVLREIRAVKDPIVRRVALFDLYEGKGIPVDHRSLAYRVTLGADDRTLTEEEVEGTIQKIVAHMAKSLGASLRG